MFTRSLRLSTLMSITIAATAAVAHANLISYDATLDGPSESPANASPGIGSATVDVDDTANTLHINIVFSGLVGTTTAAHIHAATTVPLTGTAIVATTTPYFDSFPIGVTSGTYDNTLDLTLASSYNAAYITANGGTTASAEAALLAALAAGESYVNIHTTVFPGGEIRGFLTPAPTPEPASVALLGTSSLLLLRRRRRTA